MKRRDLLKHLRDHGCHYDRRGGNHDIWLNPVLNKRAPVERHREIPRWMAEEICRQLAIPKPGKQ
jgi:hypothetical protein